MTRKNNFGILLDAVGLRDIVKVLTQRNATQNMKGYNMTRKHFKAIAEAIAKITDDYQRAELAESVADVCKASNPNFKRDLFYRACGVKGE